ncbi:flavodoxin [Bacillus sp. THAF10]|uniref:flavodoxin n=1 Tax=Bacillus sp. THAF10 TaxID=2587848 RepID=UPI00126861EF|nr:flavodoxin [Bacillus sp. THAF10]
MRVFIGYVSMSGNTEDIATLLYDELNSLGCDVLMECLDTVDTEELLTYTGVLIGSYTWGDGDLPYEAEDFYEELGDKKLSGVMAGCFGSGDYDYPKFCAAVDIFASKLNENGAQVFDQLLKVELSPESTEQQMACKEFARSFYFWLKERNIQHVS